ncbi:gamma-tubulin complex component protein [Mortierella sp. GBAus27b]|nr:gamma-tubulin complex component protein [Mortierella sp. GBAus27b]
MLHELLITLSGYPGDLFRPFPPAPATATTFAITDFPLLHPAEKESLDRLAQLGFYYRVFNNFVSACLRPALSSKQHASSGLYLRALANALERKLQDYRQVIIQTEAAILSGEDNLGAVVPLPTIAARFAPFQLVFPSLSSLVSEIERASATDSPYVGGRLIDLLQERADSGVPIQREWMNELLRGCCVVMMRQIVSWVIYGQLQDPYDEFFILQLQPTDKSQDAGSRTGHASRSQLRSRSARSSSSRLATSSSSLPSTSNKWEAEFTVDESMLPAMIPVALANSMLFIGKSIITAKQAKPRPIPIPQTMTDQHLNLILPLTCDSPNTHAAGQYDLSFKVLNVSKLTNVINQIRGDIANHLWVEVRIGEKVVRTLESFRRYFLLSDGEFCLRLIDALEEFERNRLSRLGRFVTSTAPTVSIRDHDLGGLLIKASQGTLAQDDPMLRRFELRLLKLPPKEHADTNRIPNEDDKQKTPGMFDDQLLGIPVRLWYILAWPLDFFLTAEDLGYYGDVFAYLITIRKTQKTLEKTWIDTKFMTQEMNRRRRGLGTKEYIRRIKGVESEEAEGYEQEEEILKHVAAMRSDMNFVVNCLWTYLQMDVIGPIYDALLRNLMKRERDEGRSSDAPMLDTSAASRSFDSIHSLHAEALHELRRACLLTSESLSSCIKDLLTSAVAFCGILGRRAAGQEGFQVGIGEKEDNNMWEDWTNLSSQHEVRK